MTQQDCSLRFESLKTLTALITAYAFCKIIVSVCDPNSPQLLLGLLKRTAIFLKCKKRWYTQQKRDFKPLKEQRFNGLKVAALLSKYVNVYLVTAEEDVI